MASPLLCMLSLSWASPALRTLPTIRAAVRVQPLLSPLACESSLTASADKPEQDASADELEQDDSFSLNTPAIPAAEPHDYFNLAATSTIAVLVTMAHAVHPRWNRPLALFMCAYLVVDSVWLLVQPEVAGGTAGGGALTILGHHAVALLVALHAATWPLHTRFTSQMAVVELNTLVLMLERTVTLGGAVVTATLHKLFVASWVATRLVWFPFLALRLSLIGGYPSLARRLVCVGSLLALTALQIVWTWNFCVPPEKRVALL